MKEKIKTKEELINILNKERKNKNIIWTNGCFYLIHDGHKNYLKEARSYGDILIVGINSDSSIKKLKNRNPIKNEYERALDLAALPYVNYVIIFNELSPLKILKLIKPSVYVKGGDYTIDTINQEERRFIESYGAEIKITQLTKGVSTTKLLQNEMPYF
ncbi:adenylyltransferase/cytidyltransferase family protein [Candidatus Pacearchaeota archaeon]|nr:adenylyltransferase/cytidyltransferase family protein [Candidatus Pacearchaeota archaeon]